MKIQTMIMLITLLFPMKGYASEPYTNNDLPKPDSMVTIEEEEPGYDAANEDGTAFPKPSERSKHVHPHQCIAKPLGIIPQTVRSGSSDVTTNPDTRRSKEINAHGESMRQFSTIEPGTLFDREAYLRAHVQGLIGDEERFGRATRACRWCNITWNGLGGASTATSLIVSAVGASEYMEPRLANIVTIVLGVFSGACIWAGTQAKKISHQYHEEQNDIQHSLGVPRSWLDREVRIDIDQFNARGAADTAPSAAAR